MSLSSSNEKCYRNYRDNQNTFHSQYFLIVALRDVEKYCTAGQTTDDNMARAHCMLDI
jgi:hypothetical protein